MTATQQSYSHNQISTEFDRRRLIERSRFHGDRKLEPKPNVETPVRELTATVVPWNPCDVFITLEIGL